MRGRRNAPPGEESESSPDNATDTPPAPPPPRDADEAEAPLLEGEDPDDLFVRSSGKGLVARYGALGRGGVPTYVGAVRDRSQESGVRYDTGEIVRIPGAEFRRFNREYLDAIETGALVKVKRSDYRAAAQAAEAELEKVRAARKNMMPEQLEQRRAEKRAAAKE